MLNTICLLITTSVLIWRLYTGNTGIGGEIFIPFLPMLIKFLWSYYKAEREDMNEYIKAHPEEFED